MEKDLASARFFRTMTPLSHPCRARTQHAHEKIIVHEWRNITANIVISDSLSYLCQRENLHKN